MRKRKAGYRKILVAAVALMAILTGVGGNAVSAAGYIAAPYGLKATSVTSTSVDLSWKAPSRSSRVKSYDVYMDSKYLASVSTTTFTAEDLLPSTTHIFYVKAKDYRGNTSRASRTITVKTEPATSTAPTVTVPATTTTTTTVTNPATSTNSTGTGYSGHQRLHRPHRQAQPQPR